MRHNHMSVPRHIAAVIVTLSMLSIAWPRAAGGQEADPQPATRDTTKSYPNDIAGELTPGAGFDIIRTRRGSLNVSMYGVFRYITQNPGGQ